MITFDPSFRRCSAQHGAFAAANNGDNLHQAQDLPGGSYRPLHTLLCPNAATFESLPSGRQHKHVHHSGIGRT